jgi:hypothetical protein
MGACGREGHALAAACGIETKPYQELYVGGMDWRAVAEGGCRYTASLYRRARRVVRGRVVHRDARFRPRG